MHARPLKLLGGVAAAVWMALAAVPAHASSNPAITDIAVESQACANICFRVTVDNPAAGTITLRLTGHTPGGGDDWVDVGAPHVTLDIAAGKTSYEGCFGDVSQLIAGKGFNSLRIDVLSSTVPNLEGTTTKSASFTCSSGSGGGSGGGSSGGSGGGSSGGSGGGSGQGSSGSTSTTLAATGGFDYGFLLIGLLVLVGGLALFVITARRRLPSPR